MTSAVHSTRQGVILTTSCVLSVLLLVLVIAFGVSVGELSIPMTSVFQAIGNKTGLTHVPLSRIMKA